MSILRVLVCGTNYGRSYLDAIEARPQTYCLAGIVARGSARSYEVARARGVPLYTRVADTPLDIDMACVATGISGFDVTLDLLDRRVHVLVEHPCRSEHIRTAIELAHRRRVGFHTNPHFPYLSPARAFIRHGARLGRTSQPAFVDAMITERSLYGALEILRRVLGPFGTLEFTASRHTGPFLVVNGHIADVPICLHIQTSPRTGSMLPDGSARYLVDCRVVVGWTQGMLTLCSMAGPVVWNVNLGAVAVGDPLCCTIYGRHVSVVELYLHRRLANIHAMDQLASRVYGRSTPADQEGDHVLDVSRSWETLLELL